MKRLILLALLLTAPIAFARIARLKLYHPRRIVQQSQQIVLWIATDGSAGGLGSYASPLDYATSLGFTNYYRARKDGCYSDGLCVTNAYIPPVTTNSPVMDFPLNWFVEQIP